MIVAKKYAPDRFLGRWFSSPANRKRLPETRERLAAFVEHHIDCVFEVDASGNFRGANARAQALTGFGAEELLGKNAAVVVPAEQLQISRSQWQRVFAGETVEYHSVVARKDGRRLPVRVTAIPVSTHGEVVSMYAIVRDITTERSTVTELIEYTDQIRALNAVAIWSGASARQQVTDILECGAHLLGLDCGLITRTQGATLEVSYVYGHSEIAPGRTYLLNETYASHTHETRQPLLIADLNAAPWNVHPARNVLPRQSYIGSAYTVAGAPYGTVAFAATTPRATGFGKYDTDLIESICTIVGFAVERALHEEHLNSLAFHDPLTGLANRALMQEQLAGRLAAARRTGSSVAVYFLDLDKFKYVNDTCGHAAGDEVLRVVARRLELATRESDTLARLGGDEFVLLQSGISDPLEAAVVARRIVAAMKAPIRGDGVTYEIGTSVGIALFPSDGDSAAALLERADEALYAVKKSGRGSARFANFAFEPLLRSAGAERALRALDGLPRGEPERAMLEELRVAGE